MKEIIFLDNEILENISTVKTWDTPWCKPYTFESDEDALKRLCKKHNIDFDVSCMRYIYTDIDIDGNKFFYMNVIRNIKKI